MRLLWLQELINIFPRLRNVLYSDLDRLNFQCRLIQQYLPVELDAQLQPFAGLGALGTSCALSWQQAGGETHWLNEIPVSYTSYNSTCQLKTVPVGFQQAHFASLLLFERVVKRAAELCLLLLPRGGQELLPLIPGGIKAGAQPPC